jgi:Hypoxia induced protein conserved region
MNYVIIGLIVIAAGFVLFNLVRGLVFFAQTSDDLTNGAIDNGGPNAGHVMQNKMMFARVKWQAITILLLVVLGVVAGGAGN